MSKSNKMLSQQAYQYILDLIMTQQLRPNDKVPESMIAQEFQSSRTPVRDAIQKLANEGLLEIFPKRFVRLKEYSSDEIIDVGTLRLTLDMISIKLASLFGSRADFMKLDEIASQCEEAYIQNNQNLKRELDCKFHRFISEITGNTFLIKFQNELYLQVQYIMLFYPNSIEWSEEHVKQHHLIANTLMENNMERALELIVDHLTAFYNLGAKYPENFFLN